MLAGLVLLLLSSSIFTVQPMIEEKLSILSPSNPILRSVAEPVLNCEEILSREVQDKIDQMFSIAKGERGDTEGRVMVGLAAPQVGWTKQVILVDVGFNREKKACGELQVFINPEIIWQSDEMELDREGCYSVEERLIGLVWRARKIKVVALDRCGYRIEDVFEGFTARIFQHEIDHLKGIRFPDIVGEKGAEEGMLHWVEQNQWSEYKANSVNWPHTYAWNDWLKMKFGVK